MNFFKLYIGDYQRDTGTLTLSEHGAYLLMLQHYYATEQPLPTGKELHRLLRAENKAEREAIDSVVSRFWHATEQGLINERALEEIKKGQHQRAVNQEIGKRGGRPKKTDSVTHSDMGSVGDSVSENKTDSITDSVSKNNRKANRSETLTRHQTYIPFLTERGKPLKPKMNSGRRVNRFSPSPVCQWRSVAVLSANWSRTMVRRQYLLLCVKRLWYVRPIRGRILLLFAKTAIKNQANSLNARTLQQKPMDKE